MRLPVEGAPDSDDALVAAFERYPVIAGLVLTSETSDRPPNAKAGFAFGGADPATYLANYPGGISNLPALDAAVRAGVYVGSYSARVREKIWTQVMENIEGGNAVLAYAASNDAGFAFETCGANRRVPVDFDGLRLVAFGPEAALPARGG